MTLREALKTVDLQKVYNLINRRDKKNAAAVDRPSLQVTIDSYSRVVNELLSKPKTKAYKYPWYIKYSKDILGGTGFIDVCFLNPNYVKPPKGMKPWGGRKGSKIPKGHYNCNLNKYSQFFSTAYVSWSKTIDTPIINDAGCSMELAIAELLWMLTFDGWTEAQVKQGLKSLEKSIAETKKEIKEGKYIDIPPKSPGKFSVRIPNSVMDQIKNITKKMGEK